MNTKKRIRRTTDKNGVPFGFVNGIPDSIKPVLLWMQAYPNKCKRTSVLGMVVDAVMDNAFPHSINEQSVAATLSRAKTAGLIIDTQSQNSRFHDFRINYFFPNLPKDILETASEEDKELIKKTIARAKEVGGAIDRFGAIVTKMSPTPDTSVPAPVFVPTPASAPASASTTVQASDTDSKFDEYEERLKLTPSIRGGLNIHRRSLVILQLLYDNVERTKDCPLTVPSLADVLYYRHSYLRSLCKNRNNVLYNVRYLIKMGLVERVFHNGEYCTYHVADRAILPNTEYIPAQPVSEPVESVEPVEPVEPALISEPELKPELEPELDTVSEMVPETEPEMEFETEPESESEPEPELTVEQPQTQPSLSVTKTADGFAININLNLTIKLEK